MIQSSVGPPGDRSRAVQNQFYPKQNPPWECRFLFPSERDAPVPTVEFSDPQVSVARSLREAQFIVSRKVSDGHGVNLGLAAALEVTS